MTTFDYQHAIPPGLYCHICAAQLGIVSPRINLNGLPTQYQMTKIIKHVEPTGTYPVNSVFDSKDLEKYGNYVASTAASGYVEVKYDQQSRIQKNLVFFAGGEPG